MSYTATPPAQPPLNATVAAVTDRIRRRSADSRADYLGHVDALRTRARGAERLGCANVAHAFAGMPANDKLRVVAERAPHIGIVTAYNDMLSAHQPYEGYPEQIRRDAAAVGATVQVAGGVPAMCDGVTQGAPGMELSLFSRDTIAMSTAIALSHDVFDAVLLLGICDKIVPGLLIGALQFGHLPCVFVPAGPMSTGLSNKAKSKVREQAAQGLVGRAELLEAESKAYHGPGTCTFYGTANSNQMLLEAMGLHVPGAAFVHPHDGLRTALTREAVHTVLSLTRERRNVPIGVLVDERCIVNAMVALLATGGSTNHLIHWVAVARAAGILIDWSDFAELSTVIPLLSRVYPNGSADVNQFQAAGGPGFVLRELLKAGLAHADVATVAERGMAAYGEIPSLQDGKLHWTPLPEAPIDDTVVRTAAEPFGATGGLKLLEGNLGRSVIKVSAVPADKHVIEAPAQVFDAQEDAAARVQGRHAGEGFRRRRALAGPARQRHARAAQADAAAGRAAGPRLQGGAGDRRPHERRVGQRAGRDPRQPRGAGRRAAGQGARRRPDPARRGGRHAAGAGARRRVGRAPVRRTLAGAGRVARRGIRPQPVRGHAAQREHRRRGRVHVVVGKTSRGSPALLRDRPPRRQPNASPRSRLDASNPQH